MTSASDMATCSGVAGGLAAGQEKAAWYREVLDLEPGSKVFLPYARLLLELDREHERPQSGRPLGAQCGHHARRGRNSQPRGQPVTGRWAVPKIYAALDR